MVANSCFCRFSLNAPLWKPGTFDKQVPASEEKHGGLDYCTPNNTEWRNRPMIRQQAPVRMCECRSSGKTRLARHSERECNEWLIRTA